MARIFIIAEAGVNHNGDIEMAKKLVDAAVSAGADAVKFQTFKAERIVSRIADKAEYQKKTTNLNESQFDMIKKLELDESAHRLLKMYCKKRSIGFLSSPFDIESVHFLNELGLEIFKIPSGEITNYPYLREIGKLKRRVILSTGMADLSEVESALNVLIQFGTPLINITLLHCNTEYPTPLQDVNLRAMLTLKKHFHTEVGYSDHTLGDEVAVAAAALGARIVEKHFTLDKNLKGPDHSASMEPAEFKNMVGSIRNVEIALGQKIKKLSHSEIKNVNTVRKSITAARHIEAGEFFTEENLCTKRPGTGLSPMRWNEILGKRASVDFDEDDLIVI